MKKLPERVDNISVSIDLAASAWGDSQRHCRFPHTHTLACNYMLRWGAKIFTCSLTAQCVYDNYDSVHVEKLPSNYMLVCK